jgi:hypothetical protein
VEDGGLTCPRDGTSTRLTCASCGTPICPSCFVRTPIGLKCAGCVGAAPVASRQGNKALVVVAALLAIATGGWLLLRDSSPTSDDQTEEAPEELTEAVSIGEETRDGPFTFIVTRFECGGKEIGLTPAVRTAQGRFCLVYVRVRNDGARPEFFDGSAQLLLDSEAREYLPNATFAPLPFGPPGAPPAVPQVAPGVHELTEVLLNPGSVAEGVLVFDVPQNVTPAQVSLRGGSPFGFLGQGARVRLS